MERYKKLSVFISLLLRHKPEAANLKLDANGWCNVNNLITGINNKGHFINMEILQEIVANDAKQRYSFNDDGTYIRANQGHSIPVDVELKRCVPPVYLYHGTATKYIDSIKQNGIQRKTRLYTHLSSDVITAKCVGERHGTPVILVIMALAMHELGYAFYISENGVWLTEEVPVQFIREIIM